MSRVSRVSVIAAGYAAALLAAIAACAIAELVKSLIAPPDSGGMAAAGELFLFCGLFGLFALVPTALALWFLRSVRSFWIVFAILALLFAATGPVAAIAVPRSAGPDVPVLLGLLALLRILGTPLLGLGFLITALIAPTRRSRRALFAVAATEGVVATYAVFCLAVAGRWLL